MVAGNGLAGQGGGAGHLQKMQENAVGRLLEVVGRNLAGHIHGDPALQPQHHLLKGAVEVVDLVQVQTLFQHHGHAEHPLFGKLRIFGHLRHGHVAVHGHRRHGLGEHRGLQEVQLAVHHLPQAEVGLGGGQLEGHGRHLQLVKMDDLDVFVQVELVQLGEEVGDVAGALLGGLLQKPALYSGKAHGNAADLLRVAADQLGHGGDLRRRVHLAGHEGGHGCGELVGVPGLSGAGADAKDGGGVIVGVLAQARQIDIQRRDQRVEVPAQLLLVRGHKVLAGGESLPHGFGGNVRRAPLRGDLSQSAAQPLKGLRAQLRHTLAVFIPAEGGGGYAGQAADLPRRAGELADVFV